MIKVQHYLWYVQGFFKKYKAIIVVSIVIGVGMFIALPSLLTIVPFGKPTEYIGRVGVFPLSRLPRDIQEQVSFGLTRVEADGQVSPALASSFGVEEDGKAYRFTLRPDVKWQDGQTVTPQDVTYNFSDIDVVRSPNDIVYRLQTQQNQTEQVKETFLPSSFPAVVTQPLFKQVRTRSLFGTKTIVYGMGAYTITDIVYKGPGIQEFTLDSPKNRKVYRFYPTEHDAIVAFKQGEIDRIDDIQDLEDIFDWPTLDKHLITKTDQYVGVFFNLGYQVGEDHPYGNKQLRQALNLAIQKPQGTDRILSPIYKRSWAYVGNEDDLDHFEQDTKLAVETYLKANLFTPLAIELTTIPSYAKEAELVKASWEQLGKLAKTQCQQEKASENCDQIDIAVSIHISNIPDLSNYQVLLVGQQIPLDPDQYSLWHSTQPTNFTHYKNARTDKLLEDGRKSTNKEERKLLYQEFQTLLVKESPVIFLEAIKTYTVERKGIL
ncbi:MAG: ABC transporter substrate-binding protein [Candidatus Woesebacteria bacterium]